MKDKKLFKLMMLRMKILLFIALPLAFFPMVLVHESVHVLQFHASGWEVEGVYFFDNEKCPPRAVACVVPSSEKGYTQTFYPLDYGAMELGAWLISSFFMISLSMFIVDRLEGYFYA